MTSSPSSDIDMAFHNASIYPHSSASHTSPGRQCHSHHQPPPYLALHLGGSHKGSSLSSVERYEKGTRPVTDL